MMRQHPFLWVLQKDRWSVEAEKVASSELPLGSIVAINMVLFNLLISNLGKKASEIKMVRFVFTTTVTAWFGVFSSNAHCSKQEYSQECFWPFINLIEFRQNFKKFQSKPVN